MYVALRWLTALAFAMWLGLCCLDVYLMEYRRNFLSTTAPTYKEDFKFNNGSTFKDIKIENITTNWHVRRNYKLPGVAIQHYVMFLAGAFAVLIYNKKYSLIHYTRNKMCTVIKFLDTYISTTDLKITAHVSVAMLHYWSILRNIIENYLSKVIKQSENGGNTNLALLKRLKDLAQDRKALGQLLMAAIHENKSIRRQYQLEAVTKNRLLRYVQDTQKLMKENRSRYVDFQKLYLATERENCVLKNSIKELKDEKDDAEKNLMELINVVYRSKNDDLKTYCTRFIVHTKKNLLNSDVSAEIRKFLQKSNKSMITLLEEKENKSLYLSGQISPRVIEILEDDWESSASSGPRLRGLPGEYVWTVKDKNGIIEKLYEYNYGTDYDNGDTIRRIRQYSVYHDKDCFLDHACLTTNIPTCPSLSASATRIRLDIKSLSSQGFLTKLLMKNHPLRLPSTAETLPLPYTSL